MAWNVHHHLSFLILSFTSHYNVDKRATPFSRFINPNSILPTAGYAAAVYKKTFFRRFSSSNNFVKKGIFEGRKTFASGELLAWLALYRSTVRRALSSAQLSSLHRRPHEHSDQNVCDCAVQPAAGSGSSEAWAIDRSFPEGRQERWRSSQCWRNPRHLFGARCGCQSRRRAENRRRSRQRRNGTPNRKGICQQSSRWRRKDTFFRYIIYTAVVDKMQQFLHQPVIYGSGIWLQSLAHWANSFQFQLYISTQFHLKLSWKLRWKIERCNWSGQSTGPVCKVMHTQVYRWCNFSLLCKTYINIFSRERLR